MRGLIEDRKGAVVIVAVVLMLSLAVLATSLYGSGSAPAQAHDDGTLHIHPTLTPTPLPPLGLNGPLSLSTGMVYERSQHRLVVTTVVNNSPPEGWRFNGDHANVHVNYKGWDFSTDASSWDDRGRVALHDNVLTANLALPEYVDLTQLTEPMITSVYVSVEYHNDRGQDDLGIHERMFVDLRDRASWRE